MARGALLGVIRQLPQGASQGLMKQVEVDDHHQAAHQDSQGDFPSEPEVSGQDQHRQDRPVGDFQVARGQISMRPSLLILVLFAQHIDVAKTGDDSKDQADVKKYHVVKDLGGEQVTQTFADGNGKHQGKADGTGPISPRKRSLAKNFWCLASTPVRQGLSPQRKRFFSHVPTYHTPTS